MASANASVPDDRQIVVRIGVHLGDVMVEGSDLYGDGVNIAARHESIAEPGGICISEDAFRQVRNKLDCAFDDLGPQSLKNITEPVRAYRIACRDVRRGDRILPGLARAAACAQLGRMQEARTAVAEFKKRTPEGYDIGVALGAQLRMCTRPEEAARWREGYRKAGLPV